MKRSFRLLTRVVYYVGYQSRAIRNLRVQSVRGRCNFLGYRRLIIPWPYSQLFNVAIYMLKSNEKIRESGNKARRF